MGRCETKNKKLLLCTCKLVSLKIAMLVVSVPNCFICALAHMDLVIQVRLYHSHCQHLCVVWLFDMCTQLFSGYTEHFTTP